jgi:hypothetical protein
MVGKFCIDLSEKYCEDERGKKFSSLFLTTITPTRLNLTSGADENSRPTLGRLPGISLFFVMN